MVRRPAALISPGFKKRKIPRELLLDPPRRKSRWWIWLPLVAIAVVSAMFAIDAAAEAPGSGQLMFGDKMAVHLSTDIAVSVTGIVARTEVTQRFRNETGVWQNAVYLFPLPDRAAVNAMEMRIGDRVITARVEVRDKAKALYEQAKRAGKQAALTEQERPNLFTQSVANIAPYEEIEVRLRYLDTARFGDGSFSLRVPLTITPRYVPGKGIEPDASAATMMSPVAARSGDSHRATLSAKLRLGFDVESITGDYHHVMPVRQGDEYSVALATDHVPMDRDFVLRWRPVLRDTPKATLYTERIAGDDYGLLMVLPPASQRSMRIPRDMIFVIDTSGSMKGTSMRQARKALQRAIEVTLGPQDRFNIIEFDSDYSTLFRKSLIASENNLSRAYRFIGGLNADGGTEMEAPLRVALEAEAGDGLLKHIIFLTDGAVGNEQALLRLIYERLGSARLFTVGIGSAPNSYFMRKAAEFGGGTFTFIGDVNEVSDRIESLFTKLARPSARDIRIDWGGSAPPDTFPDRLPALYDSEPLLVLARSEYLTGGVQVRANLGERAWQTNAGVVRAAADSGIAALWAREKIESLEDALVRDFDGERIRRDIIEVAMAHQLVSRFTSLVAIESFVARMPLDPSATTQVGNRLAKGQVIQMPATATHANLAFILGALALLAAAGLRLLARRS